MPQKTPMHLGLLENSDDRMRAVEQIVRGEPLVMQLGGVYGLFINAENENSVERIFNIKGESKRSLTLVKRTDDIISLAHESVIHTNLLEKLHEMGKNLGLVAHLRFPIDASHIDTLPKLTYSFYTDEATGNSYPVVQYLDPSSHVYMSELISLLKQNGVQHVAVTSFNNHAIGEPEITSRARAIDFSEEKSLPMILEDSLHARKDISGSYAIVLCFRDKIELVRPGAVDARIINSILDNKLYIKDNEFPSTKHDFGKLIELLNEYNLTGEKAKNAFVLYMMGIAPENILQKLH